MKNVFKLAAIGVTFATATTFATPAFAQTTEKAACTVRNADAVMISHLPVDLPAMALINHMSGTALVEVQIAEDGKAQTARVVGSTGWPTLDEAATTAVLAQSFSPAIRDCAPVNAAYDIQVQF